MSSASASSASSVSSRADDIDGDVGNDGGEQQRGSWGAFRWNTLSHHFSQGGSSSNTNANGGPSSMDFARNFDVSSPTEESPERAHLRPEDASTDTPDEEEFDDEDPLSGAEEGPLLPGLYKALYPFEPEGTAEMALEEDQIVRVVGRGGGVGWAVVVKDEAHGGGHALVPESYLELVQILEEKATEKGDPEP